MNILRFLFPILITIFMTLHPSKIKWLAFQNSQWEKLKWLFLPLLLQTILEMPFQTSIDYLPSRFCMILISILLFLTYFIVSKNWYIPAYDIFAYLIALRLAFLFERHYLSQNYIFHPYDPIYASIGLLFLLLIFILNTYYPPNHWLFSQKKSPH